jgi:myo-inositol 2-dehydrogenase / D-chiro-inositol 1-dehydrogenase
MKKLSTILDRSDKTLNRRQFAARAGASMAPLVVLTSGTVRTFAANSKIKLGIVGCGGRGIFVANLFKRHGGYDIVAAADYFSERVNDLAGRFQIPAGRSYTGLSCYKRLIESDVEAVAIESPPYFHPEQVAAAVAAGKHVYLAKPIAVDVPGCLGIEKDARQAAARKLVFLVDFQTRANAFFKEAVKRTQEGAIGDFAFGEATYHAGNPFEDKYQYLEADPHSPENRLRAWGLDRALSGDIITEQNIHALDVMSWIMNTTPVSAVGTGGLGARRKLGSCWDHFTLHYLFPGNLGVTFSSRQFNGHGTTPEGIRNRMFGSKGVLETEYGGKVLVRGENFYRGGETNAIYEEGAANNVAAFHQAVTNGNSENETVAPSVRSNLVTILGRMAAYTGEPVTWDQMLKANERLDGNLSGLKD